jgi:hypothetical protein
VRRGHPMKRRKKVATQSTKCMQEALPCFLVQDKRKAQGGAKEGVPFVFQQMLSHNYERTVTIKDKDGKEVKKFKVVKLIRTDGLHLQGDTLYCDLCHHKIAYKNAQSSYVHVKA